MQWKIRKDKLREGSEPKDTSDAVPLAASPSVVDDPSPASVDSSSAIAMPAPPPDIIAMSSPSEADTSLPAFAAADPLILDKPSETLPAAPEEPSSFSEASHFEEGPTFDALTFDIGQTFDETSAFDDADSITFGENALADEAPVFSIDSSADAFTPYQPEAIALGTETAEIPSGTAPEVGAMPFSPQSPSPEPLSPSPAFSEDESTSLYEPAFEAPEPLTASLPGTDSVAENEPFMDRDALAAGLVTTETETGLPRVAPFVLQTPAAEGFHEVTEESHTLIVRLGNLSASYPVAKEVMTIGRPDSITQNYPDVEIELDDGVSRKHAEVRRQDGNYYLVDLGSTNGTSLNGELLPANQPTRLMHGDRVRIGERTEIVFE